jgi:hypothetical protein
MAMNCPHHVMWVVEVEHGLHRCIHCRQTVGRKDVSPPFDGLSRELQERWEAHERKGQPPAAAPSKAP